MANTNTGKDNSGSWNTGDRNTGNRNTGSWNSGNRNTGSWNSGNRNTGSWNTGNRNTGDGNIGDGNSGYGNKTNHESGIFCSEEGTVRLFNKPTNLKWDDIDHPHFDEFELNVWVPESEMTDAEKEADPQFFVRGGYLKTVPWEEAWAKFWKETDAENRQKFLNLPNFDPVVFKDITGIDVEQKDSDVEAAIKLLTDKGKLVDGKILN